MRDTGFIKINRKLLEWEWYDDINTFKLFIHLLLKANYKTTKYRGYDIPVGALVTGHSSLSKQTSLSVMQVRTALKKLEITGVVTIKKCSKFSIVSMVNWNQYQDNQQASNREVTGNQQASNREVTGNQQASNREVTPSKERKKGRKEETNNNAKINFASFPSPPDKKLLADWLKVRKTKRLVNTQTAIDAVGREMHKAIANGYTVSQCLQIMVEKSWGGFTASWLRSSSFSDSSNKLHIVKSATFRDVKNEGGMTW